MVQSFSDEPRGREKTSFAQTHPRGHTSGMPVFRAVGSREPQLEEQNFRKSEAAGLTYPAGSFSTSAA
jgi:hypothetical protein